MPNRVFKDPDLRHFSAKLRYTTEGKRYLARWNQLNITRKMLLGQDASAMRDAAMTIKTGPTGVDLISLLRTTYIRQCNACSEALSELEKRHQWPP